MTIAFCFGIRTRTSSKGRYLRKLFPKIGLGLGLGDLSSETISEDRYLPLLDVRVRIPFAFCLFYTAINLRRLFVKLC